MDKKEKAAGKVFTLLQNTLSVVSGLPGMEDTKYMGPIIDLIYKELEWNGVLEEPAGRKNREQLQAVLKDSLNEYFKALHTGKRKLMGNAGIAIENDFLEALSGSRLDMEAIEHAVNSALSDMSVLEGGFYTPLDIHKMTADFLAIFLRRIRGAAGLSSEILWAQAEKMAEELEAFYSRMVSLDARVSRLEGKESYNKSIGVLWDTLPPRGPIQVLSHGPGAVSVHYIPRSGLEPAVRAQVKTRKMALLYGIGGIGKTQACCYIYEQYLQGKWRDQIDGICFLAYDGDEDRSVCQWLKTQKTGDYSRDVEQAWGILEEAAQHKHLLLLIDDIRPGIQGICGETARLEKIKSLHCAVLFFSRESDLEGFLPLPIGPLPEKDCRKLFLSIWGKAIGPEETEQLSDLIRERWGRHTLVIDLAARAMAENGWGLAEMQQRMADSGFRIEQGADDKTIQEEIEKLYRLAGISETGVNILQAFSIFPHLPLSLGTAKRWLKDDAGLDEDKFCRVLYRLAHKGWLQCDVSQDTQEEQYMMHQMVAAAVRGQKYPSYTEHRNLLRMLLLDLCLGPADVYKKVLPYFPYALTVTSYMEHEESILIGSLFERIGDIYFREAQYEDAAEYHQKAFEKRQALLGDRNLLMAYSYNNLADVYERQGKYNEAEAYYRKSLKIIKRTLGKETPSVATIYDNLGEIFRGQHKYREAEELYQKALALRLKLLGEDHLDTAASYNNLAVMYNNQGCYEKAELYYKESMYIKERLLCEDHPSLATGYHNLACVYQEQGKYKEAGAYYGRALAIRRTVLGEKHPDTADSFHGAASAYREQGDYQMAEAYYRKALEIREDRLGSGHPSTLASYSRLAMVCREQKKCTEAAAYYKRIMELRKKISAEETTHMAAEYLNLAAAYLEQTDFTEAEAWCKTALELLERILGEDALDTGSCYNILACVYAKQHKQQEAEHCFGKALLAMEKCLAQGEKDTETIYYNLEVAYRGLGKDDEAKEYRRRRHHD